MGKYIPMYQDAKKQLLMEKMDIWYQSSKERRNNDESNR